MKVIPYASVIGSMKYAMLCTRPIVCLAMGLARRYKRAWEIFLGYGGDKEFIVKSYVDESFDTDS